MYLVVNYKVTGANNVAQLPNNNTDLGVTGVNFVGGKVNPTTMALTNPAHTNNSDKGSILPANQKNSGGTYVDKIISITFPDTIDGTTINYFSDTLDNLGINSNIIGIEPLGMTRVEADNLAAFMYSPVLLNSIVYQVSKGRLIITIPNKPFYLNFSTAAADLVAADAAAILALMNAARPALATGFQGATLNLRITYKN